MIKKYGLRAFISALLVISMLLLAGCGNSTSSPAKSSPSPASSAPSSAPSASKPAADSGASTNKISLSTASIGGAYYVIGAGIADVLTKNAGGLKVDAVVAQGSVGNPNLVDKGETQLGMTNYESGVAALKGDKPYNKSLKIAGIMPLQFSILHMVTTDKNKDINSVTDLKGKKVAMGPAGGGGALLFQRLIPFWGLSMDDIKPSYIAYADGSDALKDGNVVLNIPHGAPPMDAITSLATQATIKFLTVDDDKFAQITAKYPSYDKAVIPAGTYKGQDKDVASIGIRDILVCNASLDEQTVYNITKTLYEHLQDLQKVHPSIKDLKMDGYKNSLVPLHPGAKKFYDEKGIKYN